MKSQKGVTMLALVIYVASFMMITGIVGAITTYFYNNMKLIDQNIATNAEYNKLNLYMAKITKNEEMSIFETGNNANVSFITFKGKLLPTSNENSYFSFIWLKNGNILYLNEAKLCTDVQDFQVSLDSTTGKNVLKVLFKVGGTTYSTEYVIK